ncbi:dienelactone hydrolase family protein [Caulobacter soli]|uniref:dienelactone hydrolase family protein n=1 Tax=Caulobacter soli TaxID=2708539 RepID=UPI0013ED7FD3|nr:dienelactone hydrolase family protein [Caulobacter soli]
MSETLTIQTPDGPFQALVVRPTTTAPVPVIVVIQEIFGVNDGIRQIAGEIAAQGYIAVCPDMFWRFEPALALSDHKPDDVEKAIGFYGRYDFDKGVSDLVATVAAARTLKGASGKVGVTGYCLGGLMTFRTLAASDADVGVAYYGGGTDNYVDEGARITQPLLMHLAGDDEYIGAAAQAKIHAALDGNPHIEIHTYPGRNHAFARPNGDAYDAADATTANARTAAFFKAHLG